MKKDISSHNIDLLPVSGKLTHKVEIIDMEKLNLGTELKYRIKTLFLGKELLFITREVSSQYIEKWKMLKKSGFPVIPLLRVTKELPDYKKRSPDSTIIVVPDITYDGSRTYGKSLSWEVSKGTYKPDLEKDQHFLNIMQNELPKLLAEVQKIVELANSLDIFLPEDSELAELVVHPNGTWKLTMIDIELVRKRNKKLEKHADLVRTNQTIARDFLSHLKNIQTQFA